MCGSPKPPAPPPDYSSQKAAFQAQQQSTYDKQAKSYNDTVTAFNTNVANFGQQVGEGSARFGNLSIAQPDKIDEAYNFWTGLKTQASKPWEFKLPAQNQNAMGFDFVTPGQTSETGQQDLFGPAATQPYWMTRPTTNLAGPATNYNNMGFGTLSPGQAQPAEQPQTYTFNGLTGFNLQAPNFQSVVTTPYAGQTVSLNIPNLINADTASARTYLGQVDNALAQVNALRQQRLEEQNRVSAFQTNYRGQLGDLNARLANITIADPNGINALEAELNRLENQRRGFTTVLSGEYGDFLGYASPEQAYTDVTSGIANLRSQRATEQARIDQFRNEQLGIFDQARNRLGSLSIANIDDIRALDTQIDDSARALSRFSSVLSPDFNRELSAYNETNSMVDRLLQQRSAEESRIGNYEQQLLQRARMLEAQAQRLGIADASQATNLQAEADALRREASGFSSQIGFDLSQELAPLANVEARLSSVGQQRSAEQARIEAYRTSLQTRLADLQSRAGALTIADLDQIRALDQELSSLDRESRSFRAELPFDFNNMFESYGDVDRTLADLYNRRNSEEQRVAFATQSAQDRANDLLRSATLSDFYDASRLDSLAFDIQNARNSASGFSSVLGADFGRANDALAQADARLAALRAQRSTALSDISSRASGITDALNTAPLQDEATQRQQRALAQQALNELAMFRGEDVAAARRSFSDILGLADQRANDLAARRTDIEGRARQMRSTLRTNPFASDADLRARRAEIDAFGTEINDFRATQAEDELADIYRILDSEGQRITADQANVAEVARRERADAQQMLARTNMERFFNQLRYAPTTNSNYDELLAYMNSARTTPSPFARALMQAA